MYMYTHIYIYIYIQRRSSRDLCASGTSTMSAAETCMSTQFDQIEVVVRSKRPRAPPW